MNTYRIHADYSSGRLTITYKSKKTLQELKTAILSEAFDSHGFYIFDNEREEPVDAFALNLSRADTITIYFVKPNEPTGEPT